MYGVDYQPTSPAIFTDLIGRLDIRHDEFDFIDIGSGKGRVLFMAALYPFKRIIGIEFSSELTAIAKRNIDGFRHREQRCHEIDAVCVDATAYEFSERPTVIYMFNPFGEPVMDRVVQNLDRSLTLHPRELFVVYFNSQQTGPLDRSSNFVELASNRNPSGEDEPWAIFRSVTRRENR